MVSLPNYLSYGGPLAGASRSQGAPLLLITKKQRQRTGENRGEPISSRRNRKVNVVEVELSDSCANCDCGIGSYIRYV